MSLETQINSIINDAKQKGIDFRDIVTKNALKNMIDFNKELKYDNLADTFIEAFKKKTRMYNENNLTIEEFAEYVKNNINTAMVNCCCFESDISDIHFQIYIGINENVTLQQIIDQTAEFLFITVYHYTDKDDFDDCDENFYVEFTSPDFRFLKKLKNTICYILRKHESKAS